MNKLFILGISLLVFSSSQAGLYRWVDESGEVHFSDKVPVAVSKKAHTKLDKHGNTRKSIDPEEAIRKQKEAEQLAIENIENEKLIQQQREEMAKLKKRDQYLLSTFDNENEISEHFEYKIKSIKGNSSILSAQSNILTKKAEKVRSKISLNKQNIAIKHSLEAKLVDINKTIEQYEKALIDNDKQIIQLSKSYEKNYKRFTELTNKN